MTKQTKVPVPKLQPTSIRLTPDMKANLQALAEADGRTLTNYIERVLFEHIEGKAKRRAKT